MKLNGHTYIFFVTYITLERTHVVANETTTTTAAATSAASVERQKKKKRTSKRSAKSEIDVDEHREEEIRKMSSEGAFNSTSLSSSQYTFELFIN